jgi:hypothetical protein
MLRIHTHTQRLEKSILSNFHSFGLILSREQFRGLQRIRVPGFGIFDPELAKNDRRVVSVWPVSLSTLFSLLPRHYGRHQIVPFLRRAEGFRRFATVDRPPGSGSLARPHTVLLPPRIRTFPWFGGLSRSFLSVDML